MMESMFTKARRAPPFKHASVQIWNCRLQLQKFEFLTKMSAACTVPDGLPGMQDFLSVQRPDACRGATKKYLNPDTGWQVRRQRAMPQLHRLHREIPPQNYQNDDSENQREIL
jgi:hypothetical protein